MTPEPALIAHHLERSFGAGGAAARVLRGVSLDLHAGEVLLLMGPSGSGKSTLLAAVSGLLRPDRGEVTVLGQDLWRMGERVRERFRLRHFGFIFQGFNLFPSLTAREQLEMVVRWGEGAGRREARRRVAAMLDQLGLGGRADVRADRLSGGEKQRVAVGRALLKQPRFCFADEPTGSLDWGHGEQVIRFMHAAARDRGAVVLLVGHDPRLVPYADRVLHLADGRLAAAPCAFGDPFMRRLAPARGLLRPALVLAAGAALTLAAVRFGRPDVAPAEPPPPATTAAGGRDAVVCFGTVDLERGVSSLGPIQPGRVAEVLVAENQAVAGGAELIRLEDGLDRSRLAEAEAAVELARVQLHQARKQPDQHRSRVAQQRAMRDAMRGRAASARRVLAHEQKLAQSSAITESERSVSEDRVRELEALEQAEDHRLAELEAQDVEAEVRRAEWELKGAEARRDQARQALDDRRIRAPRPGTVLRIIAAPGDVLGPGPGQPAVLFAADGPQVIRATVEQEFAGRVKEGEPATIHDEADPTVTWRGRVGRLAGWYSQRRTVLHDPSQLSDVRSLECLVLLDPGQQPLRLGQSVRIVIGAPDGPGSSTVSPTPRPN